MCACIHIDRWCVCVCVCVFIYIYISFIYIGGVCVCVCVHIHTYVYVHQIASLGVKSGNGVLLKCGREAVASCQAIVGALKDGLSTSKVCKYFY
jgi:hypothetical protein